MRFTTFSLKRKKTVIQIKTFKPRLLMRLSVSFYLFYFLMPLSLAGMENVSGHFVNCCCTDTQPFIQVRVTFSPAQNCILQMSE